MEWETILKIIFGVIAGVGGISGVIVAGVKFSSNIIADNLTKKYEIRLTKELEKYKSNLENKKYISKTKFDTEFRIYQEYTKAFSDLVFSINEFIPGIYVDDRAFQAVNMENTINFINEINDKIMSVKDTLNYNVPFVEKEIYISANNLLVSCERFLMELISKILGINYNFNCDTPYIEKELSNEQVANNTYRFTKEDCNQVKDIIDKLDELNDKIRDYISMLDIVE